MNPRFATRFATKGSAEWFTTCTASVSCGTHEAFTWRVGLGDADRARHCAATQPVSPEIRSKLDGALRYELKLSWTSQVQNPSSFFLDQRVLSGSMCEQARYRASDRCSRPQSLGRSSLGTTHVPPSCRSLLFDRAIQRNVARHVVYSHRPCN